MTSVRRTLARVLAALVFFGAAFGIWSVVAMRVESTYLVEHFDSPVEQALAQARANCAGNDRATGLDRWTRGDARDVLARACAGLPAIAPRSPCSSDAPARTPRGIRSSRPRCGSGSHAPCSAG